MFSRLLQLKFAKQTGLPIVPAMMDDPERWQATGWLGVITAGLLWTPFFYEADFALNIEALILQIKKVAPDFTFENEHDTSATAVVDTSNDDLFSFDELRAELQRLRADAAPANRRKSQQDIDGKCTLPAAVPVLPTGIRVSSTMRSLVDRVLSIATNSRLGLHGIGGCGKTTVTAWLCHQDEIRDAFEVILWCTLGQFPSLPACLDLIFKQLTGAVLSGDTDVHGKQEALKQVSSRIILFSEQ
eukprot:SAG31_NODE_1675_length_7552_cov_69.287228_9_plen_244_part_00